MWRDSVIIQTDTSKILFVFIQYQEGIEWNYGICAISSRLARSSISDGRRLASTSLSRHCRGRSRIWRGRLAFRLLDRLPRGVRLSAAGSLFLNDARRILQDVEDAKRRAERVALGKAGTLRIGIATAVSWHGMVADTFREFRRRQPDVELVVHHLLSVHQIEAVLSGRLDAGFAASMTPWHKELAHSQFAEDRMVLAVPKGHPLTRRKRIRLRDLQDIPFIWFQRWVNPNFYDQMMQACARGGLKTPRIVQEAPDRDTQLGLVQCQIGIAWLNRVHTLALPARCRVASSRGHECPHSHST